jgi:hypothetical protein
MSVARAARRRRKQYLSNNAQWSGKRIPRQWNALNRIKQSRGK